MASCISSCANDTQTPARRTYVNLYKWAESDAEFIRSRRYSTSKDIGHGHGHYHPRPEVVDSISCRQLYLRSYTFATQDKNKEEKTKCFGRVKSKERYNQRSKEGGRGSSGGVDGRRCGSGRNCGRWRKVKAVSCAALASIFRRLFFCTTKVEVVN